MSTASQSTGSRGLHFWQQTYWFCRANQKQENPEKQQQYFQITQEKKKNTWTHIVTGHKNEQDKNKNVPKPNKKNIRLENKVKSEFS